jgi:hypothetical protein
MLVRAVGGADCAEEVVVGDGCEGGGVREGGEMVADFPEGGWRGLHGASLICRLCLGLLRGCEEGDSTELR